MAFEITTPNTHHGSEMDMKIMQGVLDTVACGVIIVDPEMNVTRLNRSAELMTGFKEREAIGQPCADILHPFMEGEECPIVSCMKAGIQREERTLTIVSKTGKNLPVRVVSMLIHNENGALFGGIQTFGDISTMHDLRMKADRSHYFHGIFSKNHLMQKMFQVIPRISDSSSTVMIRGESGTGKELVAHAVHDLSPRKGKRFVAVNCAALPDNLLEAELFGYVKGAFTDARSNRPGRISAANGGTLFLDEVGDISPAMQVKLLRFLQERTYEPLGSNETKKADVRVVAATNRDLEAMIRRGEFREDFYYRLNVLTLEIPPLRNRIEDVPLLVDNMLQQWALDNGRDSVHVTPMALKALMSYDYPGNIRELENIIERAAVLAADGAVDLANLPDEVQNLVVFESQDNSNDLIRADLFSPIELSEREAIREILKSSGGNRISAANQLGMSRTTLWRKLKKYRLD